MQSPRVLLVKGYWIANVRVNGKATTWGLGSAKKVSEARAQAELDRRLSLPPESSLPASSNLQTLVESYLVFADNYYRRDDGSLTGEAMNLTYALSPLVDMFGGLPAAAIRPLHVKTYMDAQAKQRVSRQTINKRLGIIKRMLKWGVENEMIPATVWQTCLAIQPLKSGRGVREAKSIRAVPQAHVDQVLPFLPQTLQDMVRLQMVTAMRPEEVCAIRIADLDMTKMPWLYVPQWHKNKHRGMERRIFLGPQAREILARYILPGAMEAPLFSPRQAIKDRRGKFPRSRRITDCYDTRSYRKSIWWACDQAFPLPEDLTRLQLKAQGRKHERRETMTEWRERLGNRWAEAEEWWHKNRFSPNRIRKLSLTNVERTEGKNAAKAYAGHTRVETTQDYYLDQNDSLAKKIAEKVG